MTRIHLDAVAQLEQPMQAVEEPFGTFLGLDREVGARRVADEQRVARQQQPGLVGARQVGDGEAAVLRAVAGRVDDPQGDVADDDLVAVGERLRRVLGGGQCVHGDRDAVFERQSSVAGDVVGVRVRLEDAHDPDLAPRRLLEVLLDRVRRVDDDRLAGVLATDEIGGATEIVVDELPEQHVASRLTARRFETASKRVVARRSYWSLREEGRCRGVSFRRRSGWASSQWRW